MEQERSVCQQSREKGHYDSYHSMKALLSAILEEKVRVGQLSRQKVKCQLSSKNGLLLAIQGRKVNIEGERYISR
jgi:hypothetical protein